MATAGAYTTDDLIASVRRRAYVQGTDDGTTFPTDSDIVALANELMAEYLVPFIEAARESHFLTSKDLALVSGQQAYVIPARATAADISVVVLVDSSGNPLSWPGLQPIEPELGVQYPLTQSVYGQPSRYYFQGNSICLVPTPDASTAAYALRVYYPQRPNQLVKKALAVTITSLSVSSGSLRVGFSGSAPAGFNASASYDGVTASPGFQLTDLGAANGFSAGAYVQFAATTVPTTLAVGDWLCLQDTAPVMTGVPAELFPLMAQRVALKVNEIRRDAKGVQLASAAMGQAEASAKEFLKKRDMLAHRKVSAAHRRFWFGRPPFFVK